MESILEGELKQWKEREQRYEKLFSPSVLTSREFLKEKLKHYDEIRAKVIADPANLDKVAMRAFQLERSQLARRVYPNIFRRLVERMVSIVRINKQVTKAQKLATDNTTALRSAMNRVGLGEYFGQVQQQMKQGNRQFSLPVSYQVTEQERMELLLNFRKDERGKYHFENYRATLHSELEKGKSRQMILPVGAGDDNNAALAYNLFSGRAARQSVSGTWQQLDFTDKDTEGNFRMKHFPAHYGFDLEKELRGLPLKTTDQIALLDRMQNGEKVEVTLLINNKEVSCQMEAHPAKKAIVFYNSDGQKSALAELNTKQKPREQVAKIQQLVPQKGYNDPALKSKAVKI